MKSHFVITQYNY